LLKILAKLVEAFGENHIVKHERYVYEHYE
jgi:hypothetical protein